MRGGAARVLCVLGEAGIGKSALLAAIGARAPERMLVLAGRGAEHERDVPFGVAVDALDDHVATLAPRRIEALGPELAGVLPAAAAAHGVAEAALGAGAAERFLHHRALRRLLESLGRERPVALLLDDLHWADDASIELVLHLLRRPPRSRLLLAFALRPAHPARQLLDAARTAPGSEQLELAPLDHEESLGMLARVPDPAVRERIAREARGNPLFLRELGRSGGGELPATLRAAVELEVAELPPAALALLRGAAVAGDPFDPELAAAAAGIEPDGAALDGLVAADLARPTGHGRGFGFRHPLVRRAVYDAAPPAWRLAAHERVAVALERRGAVAAVRAYHVARFARAGDEVAIALLDEAAAAAAATSPATAARWYAAALGLVGEMDAARRAALLGPMALALADAGRLEESRDALVDVLGLLPQTPTPQRLALVAACAAVEALIGRHAGARARLVEALDGAPPAAQAVLALALATGASYTGDAAELGAWAARAAATAGDDALLVAGAEGYGALAALWAGAGDRAVPLLDRATARLRDADDAALAARLDSANQVAHAQLSAERFADGAATTARALAIARRTHQGRLLVSLLIYQAGAQANLLDLHSALQTIESAEESARLQRVPYALGAVLWQSALIRHFRGEAVEARRDAAEFGELAAALEPSNLIRTGLCGVAAIGAGEDPERTIDAMLRAGGPELERVVPVWSAWLLLALVRSAVALGRLDDAERWAALSEERSAALGLPASRVRSASTRGEVLLARGEPAAAAVLALDAADAGERSGALRDAAEARLLGGRALAAAGDAEYAKDVLQRVAAAAGRGGALRLRDAAGRELRRLGSRLSSASRRLGDADELTPREAQIAELVTHGRSNKEIAQALFLSEKTVEGVLTTVYAKFGVRSRVELALKLSRDAR